MKAILTASWAVVLFITSLPAAAAQPNFNSPTIKVDYSDLNLAGPRGVSTLEHRVTRAIGNVCGGPSFNVQETMQRRACENAAQTAASRDIQNAVTIARRPANSSLAVTPSSNIVDKAVSTSTQPHWPTHHLIPRR